MSKFFIFVGVGTFVVFWWKFHQLLVVVNKPHLYDPFYGLFAIGVLCVAGGFMAFGMQKGREIWGKR